MGMSFMLSPGVTVREWDLTQIIPQVATAGAAIVGAFEWGPLEKFSYVSDEEALVRQYGRPTDENFGYWFCAKNFLDYSRNLKVVRVVGEGAQNAYDSTATPASPVVIKNINDWQDNHSIPSGNDWGQFAGRYPSIVANGIEIHMADEDTFSAVWSVKIIKGGTGYTTADDVGKTVTFTAPFDGGVTAEGFISQVDDITGKVTEITITTNGYGYRNPPEITIPAPATSQGTTADLDITFNSSLEVDTISVVDGGSGYDGFESITIDPPSLQNINGILSGSALNESVNAITVVDGGFGYDGNEVVTIPQPDKVNSNATVTLTSDGDAVDSITIVSGGYGYDGNEAITITGAGSGATAQIDTVVDGVVTAVSITAGGTGYTGTPTAVIDPPNYPVKQATASITSVTAGVIDAIQIDDAGYGYSAGTVITTVASPNLSVSQATAVIVVSGGVVTGVSITNLGYGYAGTEGISIQPPVITQEETAEANANLWAYYDQFLTIPKTTRYVDKKNGSNDGLHVVVVDGTGQVTGDKGRVLERYAFCSKAQDAVYDDGTSSFYPYVLRDRSKYVWFGNYPPGMESGPGAWGNLAQDRDFESLDAPVAVTLANGASGNIPSNNELIPGWELFNNVEEIDIGLLITGPADRVLQDFVIQNVAEFRKDCVAFISPEALNSGGIGSGVINNKDRELDALMRQRGVLPSSSYGVFDCNWKYQFDTYNDTFRWVPLNGDIAGLCARTDETRDPWWSPAGYNRGHIKNCVKLAWNPNRTARDEMYPNSINPVVSMFGEGTLLYGDRTMLTQPSAFDRINVRRLFIVLEKAIAKAAKYLLFEFNDTFTRLRFVQMVEPYLRDVQGRRGIYDFNVVCDETNNTPFVIDNNAFVGDIYIKPARSINFITLNFVATGTGVVFDEIIGQFG
jgi:phage tail sheath protein FI